MTISICAYLMKKGAIEVDVFIFSMMVQALETCLVIMAFLTFFGKI